MILLTPTPCRLEDFVDLLTFRRAFLIFFLDSSWYIRAEPSGKTELSRHAR
jgi:hypothetical protein